MGNSDHVTTYMRVRGDENLGGRVGIGKARGPDGVHRCEHQPHVLIGSPLLIPTTSPPKWTKSRMWLEPFTAAIAKLGLCMRRGAERGHAREHTVCMGRELSCEEHSFTVKQKIHCKEKTFSLYSEPDFRVKKNSFSE